MGTRSMLFKAYYIFSKKVFQWERNKMEREYFRLRKIAVLKLNEHYSEWNSDFEKLDIQIREDDPLKEYGGSEYCKYIRNKQKSILEDINRKHAKYGVRLDSDEIGDLIAVNRRGVTLTVEFVPIKEIES